VIREALNSYALGSPRVWDSDRSQTVGASEIGQCARKIAFAKASGDPGAAVVRDVDYEDGWGAARRGSIIEDNLFVPAVLARWGSKALYVGPDQRTFVSGFLSGTPDGLLVDLPSDALKDEFGIADCGGCVDLDCKSVDPRTKLEGPKPEHVFQVQVQMGLIRETTNHKPDYAILTYIDASFLDNVREFAIPFDPAVYVTAKDRARQIMTARHGADLRPEGAIAGGRECDYCPFTGPCGTARAARVPAKAIEIDPVISQRITTRAQLAQIKKAQTKTLKSEIGELEQAIRDDLQAAGSKSLPGVVSWASVKGREGWDHEGVRAAAAAAGVDLAPFKTIGDPSDRLTITLKTESRTR
jgi:hypothetical protein